MRWLAVLAVVSGASIASAAPASDPAFLGVGMDPAPGFCSISSITPDSPAHEAGLQFGDAIYSIDAVALARAGADPCTNLTNEIIAHRSGDEVRLDLRRGGQRLVVKAVLSTRAEVLHRRFVGEHMVRTDLADVDDNKVTYDLGSHRGGTTIVGWFLADRCAGCARVFDRIADGLRTRIHSSDAPTLLAVTASALPDKLPSMRKSFASSVPLAVADYDVFDALALKDSLRISFMVIDCRGIVRYVTPIAPDAEDLDAAVDDILAAAEQAEYQRTRRN